jgi:TMEM175 potassium channel family protein
VPNASRDASRDPERLVFFTDAVVAIAITLLVLPLADLANEPVEHPSELVTGNWSLIAGFVLSFAVIARFWLTHHRMFQHVGQYTGPLVLMNMVWIFTIVVLPFPTELVGHYSDPFTVAFYIGTVLASSAGQSVLVLIIHRNPGIQRPDNPLDRRYVARTLVATGLIAAGFVVALVVPRVTYFPLLLLLLSPLVMKVWTRLAATSR